MGGFFNLLNTIVTQYQYLDMGFGSTNVLNGGDSEEWNRRRAYIQEQAQFPSAEKSA